MDLQNNIDQLYSSFKNKDFKGVCNNLSNPQCLTAKIFLDKLETKINKSNYQYEMDYYNCLKRAYKCEKDSYRSILASLTETRDCLKQQKYCMDDYTKQLNKLKIWYQDLSKLYGLLHSDENQ